MIIPFIKNINFFELAKFMSLQKKSILPKEYQQVEYLESTGTQYINTEWAYDIGMPVYLKPNYHIVCKCGSDDDYSIFGSKLAFNLTGLNGYYKFRGYSEYYTIDNTGIPVSLDPITWDFNNNTLTADGEYITSFSSIAGSGGGRPIFLFARSDGYNVDDMGGTVRIYHFKVSSNPFNNSDAITNIRDMYPCIRKSDNKPGMYDIITNQFFTNSGTGEFITG